MWLATKCELRFVIDTLTPFVFMLRPHSKVSQWVRKEEYTITPNQQVDEYSDIYGNLCQRLLAEPGDLIVQTSAEVMVADTFDKALDAPLTRIQEMPAEVLTYLLPSRYCESEYFYDMTMEVIQGQVLGYNQIASIASWVRQSIEFAPGSSDQPISAIQVHMRQHGVCRDLSHVAIAMCRSISIPARMVVGYLYGLQPMGLHAWFEAYVGGRWYGFDPTQADCTGGYVALGAGRDAADVAVYNQFGPAVFPYTQNVSVELLSD